VLLYCTACVAGASCIPIVGRQPASKAGSQPRVAPSAATPFFRFVLLGVSRSEKYNRIYSKYLKIT